VSISRISATPPDGATASDTTKSRPEIPTRKPPDNLPPKSPKPGVKPSQTDNAGEKSAFAINSTTVVYAAPFGRPPVTLKKGPAASVNEYSEIPNYSNMSPAVKSATGVDKKAFHEYAEVCGSQSLPTLSSVTVPVYSELDAKPGNPAGGNSTHSYEYADPNAMGKWSLQHIARGVECEYETVVMNCDDDENPYEDPLGELTTILPQISRIIVIICALFRVENDRWMLLDSPPRSDLVSSSTFPQFSTAPTKSWKAELESTLHRKLSAASSSRILAMLQQPPKTRKFSVPSSFPWMRIEPTSSAAAIPDSVPPKNKDDDDDNDDDDDDDVIEEYPYEYVTCCGCESGRDWLIVVT